MVNNIDASKVKQKLIFMQDNLNKLMKLKDISRDEFMEDFRNADSAKHLLQISIEAMVDIANHIIARNRWGRPETNRESFQVLAKHGIIDDSYVDVFSTMVKFRNRIVHMYFDVSDQAIYDVVQNNLGDFEKYIKSISGACQFS